MNIFKLIFFLQLFLLAVLFVSCGEDHKCSQDFQCDSGSFCSVDSKCLDFAEGDYDITISPLEDDCSVSENVEVEVILNRKSEKLHDAMAVALKVENNDSYEILENAFYKDKSFFNLKISYCTYKLSAFLVQNPDVKSEIILDCCNPQDEDTDDDIDAEPDDDGDTVDGDTDNVPIDDADTEPDDDVYIDDEEPDTTDYDTESDEDDEDTIDEDTIDEDPDTDTICDIDVVLKKHDTDIVIDPSDEEHPVWFTSSDLVDCAESACKVKIDIFAPEGTEITYQSDSGSENIVVIGSEGFEILDLSLSLIVTTKLTIYAGTFEETYYLRATDLNPKMILKNPVVCPESAEYCNRYDLMDDPETDAIELAEVGYGYDDDLVPDDGILNVKDESAIIFYVYDSATGGVVEIENPPEGLNFTTANLVRGEQENLYIADFSSLEIADTAADGQTDYELVFVLKTDSGIVQKYLVYVHLDLKIPDAVQLSAVSADKLLAELSLSWDPLSVKPYAYELRYQSYTGSCSISDNFDSAEKPSTDYAGDIPKPQDSLMTYKFFVNKVSNSDGTLSADVHKNGNSYCAGVRAVSGVFGNKNQLFAKNYGKIGADSVHDFGALQLNWQSVYEASSGYHSFYLVTIGDVNGDSFEDYVIADKFKSDSGVDSERNGFVDVYSGKDSALLKSFRGGTGNNERVGSGVSSKADFNGDGFYDFAYTNYEGKVDIYYGSETGINFNAVPETFFSKDGIKDTNRSLTSGDFNGDGCDDILVAAPHVSADGNDNYGEIYIYFGRGEECSQTGKISGEEPDVLFYGARSQLSLGMTGILSVGDLNGDGKTDFAFGIGTGIFIVYGGTESGALGTVTFGEQKNPGYYMGSGDFNGDGYSDFVYGKFNENEVNIHYGSTDGISASPDVVFSDFSVVYDNYAALPDHAAIAVSPYAKDYNGDGIDDLVFASSTGLLIYYSDCESGGLKAQPSVFDDHISSTATNFKVIMLEDAVIYCNTMKGTGTCEKLVLK